MYAPRQLRRIYFYMRKIPAVTKFLVVILLIIIGVSAYVFAVGTKYVADLCAEEIRAEITDIINQSNDSLQKMNIYYDDYFKVTVDKDGKVELLSANTGLINQINVLVQTEIQDRLDKLRNKTLYVTTGSLFGSAVLSQYGGFIPINAQVVANCYTQLVSEFSPLGINNTLHKLRIDCYVSVKILVPTRSVVDELNNEILMAESIIEGEVPSTYLYAKDPTDYLDLLPD